MVFHRITRFLTLQHDDDEDGFIGFPGTGLWIDPGIYNLLAGSASGKEQGKHQYAEVSEFHNSGYKF